jgi:hypothetical protein
MAPKSILVQGPVMSTHIMGRLPSANGATIPTTRTLARLMATTGPAGSPAAFSSVPDLGMAEVFMADPDLGPLVAGTGPSTAGMATDHSRTADRWAASVAAQSADIAAAQFHGRQRHAGSVAAAHADSQEALEAASAAAAFAVAAHVGYPEAAVLAAEAVGTVADTDKLRS